MKQRIVILISGRGSNMEAIVQHCAEEGWPAEVVAVIANKPTAGGVAWAAGRAIATAVVDHKAFGPGQAGRDAFDTELARVIDRFEPTLVVLAGFMRILGADFVRRYEGRMLNIHPSLLPKYPGLHTHARALAAGDTEAGCTVHEVTADLDAGPILGQARVPVLPVDTEDSLAARVLVQEHRLYPAVLRRFVAGDRTPVLL